MLDVDETFTILGLSRSSEVRVKVRRWPQSPIGTIFISSTNGRQDKNEQEKTKKNIDMTSDNASQRCPGRIDPLPQATYSENLVMFWQDEQTDKHRTIQNSKIPRFPKGKGKILSTFGNFVINLRLFLVKFSCVFAFFLNCTAVERWIKFCVWMFHLSP